MSIMSIVEKTQPDGSVEYLVTAGPPPRFSPERASAGEFPEGIANMHCRNLAAAGHEGTFNSLNVRED
jgi:hypothetical protein